MRDESSPHDSAAHGRPTEVLRVRSFALFWSATTARAFGGAIAAVAFQVLMVTVLNATPLEIGILSAIGVLPYLFLGLIVGALMDRWRRQRTLVITSIGRAVVLGLVPILLLLDVLSVWSLAVIILALGVLVLFAHSAEQPLLPNLVPRGSLVMANARLSQSETVAETAGPALGGAILNLVGAPILFAFDAVLNAVSAVLQARIKVDEPAPSPRSQGSHIGHDIVDGMRYTYRHRTLLPLAISTHLWFLGNSLVGTVFGVFVLRELDVPPWAFGLALTAGGIGGFIGALFAPRLGARLGAGRAILLGQSIGVVPWVALALLPLTASSALVGIVVAVAAAQFFYGLSQGIEDANNTGYRQSVAPDGMQGRMNSTIRTMNRVVLFFGALLAGVLATLWGFQVTIGIGAAIFAVGAMVVVLSPLRSARHDDPPDTPETRSG